MMDGQYRLTIFAPNGIMEVLAENLDYYNDGNTVVFDELGTFSPDGLTDFHLKKKKVRIHGCPTRAEFLRETEETYDDCSINKLVPVL